jgi:hypothetical protein
MKQTAVEFLSEKYMYVTWLRNRDEISAEQADNMRAQYLAEAKEMEKEQMFKCKGNNDNGCFMESPGHDCGCFKRIQKEQPKKLTELEVAIKLEEIDREEYQSVKDFSRGAKWQARRMYSEEEVLEIIRQYALEEHLITSSKPDIWFKQYKKK